MSYTMDGFRVDVKKAMSEVGGNGNSGDSGSFSKPDSSAEKSLTASDLKGMKPSDVIKRVGPLFTADQKRGCE